ncbi:MAG TPA: hypothetical protein VE780_04400 [Thermoleophilaceae bacterium]|nr:hypothetical protein [Thermoleophilaceae bacterium]
MLPLAEPLTAPARIQVHDPERDWVTSEEVPAFEPGKAEYRVPALQFPAGRALRLYGEAGASNEIFVTDPVPARKRPYRRVGPDAGTQIELLMDGGLDVLFEIAELMRPELMRMNALVPGRTPQPRGDDGDGARPEPTLRPRGGQTLEDYIAACAAVANEQLIEWALVLPSLPSLGLRIRWPIAGDSSRAKRPTRRPTSGSRRTSRKRRRRRRTSRPRCAMRPSTGAVSFGGSARSP